MQSALAPFTIMVVALLLVSSAWSAAAPDAGSPSEGRWAGEAEPGDAGAPGMAYQTIAGRVAGVDRSKARVTIENQGRSVEMSYDRDTTVFLERRLGTIRDVVPGAQVRASVDRGGLAYWIEVRALEGGTSGTSADAGVDGGAAASTSPPSR